VFVKFEAESQQHKAIPNDLNPNDPNRRDCGFISPSGWFYRGYQYNVPLFGRYFVTTTYAAVLIFGTYLWQTV
jgi:hypothetical protein